MLNLSSFILIPRLPLPPLPTHAIIDDLCTVYPYG